jgi:hypothetical protein
MPFQIVHFCGLAALPLILLDPTPISLRTFLVGLTVMLLMAMWLWLQGGFLTYGGIFPYTAGMLTPLGAFSGDLVVGVRPVLMTMPLRLGLSLLGCPAGAWLLARIAGRWRRDLWRDPLVLFTSLQMSLLLLAPGLHDRYLVFLLPGIFSVVAPQNAMPWQRWVNAVIALAAFAVISIGLMHDWLSWNSARWTLGRRAVDSGVWRRDIEGGFEWNGLYAPVPRPVGKVGVKGLALPFTQRFFPDVTGDFALAFSPVRTSRIIDRQPYALWLLPGTRDFYLLKYQPDASEEWHAPASDK